MNKGGDYGGWDALPVESHSRGLHVPFREVKILLQFVEDSATAGVDAEVLARELEIWDVGLYLELETLARHQVGEEEQLLRERQDKRAKRGDVGFERVASDVHEVLRERHAYIPVLVLLLVHALVALVVRALVRAHRVHELVLGPPPLAPPVREQNRRTAHPEYAILEQH